jgi:hypothetical protein
MASFRKRDSGQWQAQVRKKGYPTLAQNHPEQTVRIWQIWSGTSKFQRCQLLPESHVFEC